MTYLKFAIYAMRLAAINAWRKVRGLPPIADS